MTPTFENVLLSSDRAVATITLNRPDELNPLDKGTVDDLHACFDMIDKDDTIELVVLRGAGRAFSAGGDLKKAVKDHQNREWMSSLGDRLRAILRRFETSDRLVIAVVEGLCVAGGIEMILACDYVLATDKAKFSDGHLNFSLLPGAGGSQRMPRLIGALKAKDILLTARFFSGAEAQQMGLVTRCVPATSLNEHLAELIDSLCSKSFSSRAAIKHLVNRGLEGDFLSGLEMEAEYVLDYETAHPDAHEGLVAFLEKRKPNFSRGR
ncbi:MAG: enoyl-CoA hydratase/isomerase family protein [Porticoccaceae bacterium]